MWPQETAAPNSAMISAVANASFRTDFLVLPLRLPDTTSETNTKSGSRLLCRESALPSTDQDFGEVLGLLRPRASAAS